MGLVHKTGVYGRVWSLAFEDGSLVLLSLLASISTDGVRVHEVGNILLVHHVRVPFLVMFLAHCSDTLEEV